jgi:hypothetical protein
MTNKLNAYDQAIKMMNFEDIPETFAKIRLASAQALATLAVADAITDAADNITQALAGLQAEPVEPYEPGIPPAASTSEELKTQIHDVADVLWEKDPGNHSPARSLDTDTGANRDRYLDMATALLVPDNEPKRK